jgi:hypothetical protein
MLLRKVLRGGAWIAVAAGASVGLLAAAHTSLQTTASLVTPSSIGAWDASYEQHRCLQAVFHRAVPRGASFYVGGAATPERQQLLLQSATLWATPVVTESSARWIVSLQPGTECFGYTLHAERRR